MRLRTAILSGAVAGLSFAAFFFWFIGPVNAATLPNAFGNQTLTPGVLNPSVSVSNIDKTICVPGWSQSVRPPASYTNALKLKQLADPRYGYIDKNAAHYEEDHVCSIENLGDPRSPKNLRPDPYGCMRGGKPCKPSNCIVTPGAKCKDLLENAEHKLICDHKMTPQQACTINAGDWMTNGYKRYVSLFK